MRTNIPLPLRQADPNRYLDACLARAFDVVLSEDVPDRFRVLLDALRQKGQSHDPAEPETG
jgi:hypothetical protein